MFFSTQILARKGPLGLVWIAAHLERQLKRQQICQTSIPSSVDYIIHPEAPLALRLSGQLLLGVVRIYARKVAYLYQVHRADTPCKCGMDSNLNSCYMVRVLGGNRNGQLRQCVCCYSIDFIGISLYWAQA